MNEKFKKIRNIIIIICLIVLLIDIVILVKAKLTKKEKAFFDSINSFEKSDDDIIAVGSNTDNKESYEKAKITLYNDKYEKKWEKFYNTKYRSSFLAVKKDNDSYVAVGNYEANKKEHKSSLRSALIVKYDKEGNVINKKDFQVLGNSKFTNLLVVDDGYIVIGQSIYENMVLGTSTEGGAFIIKYDKDLNEIWKDNYGGSKSGIYNDLLILDNNIYVVGKDSSRLGIISKYDLDGNYIDTATYKITDTFGFTGVTTDNDYLYVVGSKKVKDDENSYDTDALIVKYDKNLNKIIENSYRGKGMERFNKIILDDKSNLVIVGQTGIYNKKKSTSSLNVFSYDGILAKYNTSLKKLLIENYGNSEDDYLTDIKNINDKYVLSGYSTYKNNYMSKFITYTESGKLIEVK